MHRPLRLPSRTAALLLAALLALALLTPAPASAEVTPAPSWTAQPLGTPSPAPMGWNSSMAIYNGSIVYADATGSLSLYNPWLDETSLLLDLSGDPNFLFGPGAILVDGPYIYFTDNGMTANVYRYDPASGGEKESLDTGASGSLYAMAVNPWSGEIWAASSDFAGDPAQHYLYAIDASFASASLLYSFAKPHDGGTGPLVILGPELLLYGESVYLGDGYFHLIDLADDTLTTDVATFSGGLAATATGPGHLPMAATGVGGRLLGLDGALWSQAAESDLSLPGLASDGHSLFLGEMDDFGAMDFNALTPDEAFPGTTGLIPFTTVSLPRPIPGAMDWNGSVAVMECGLVFAASDGNIMRLDPATGVTELVCDLSGLPQFLFGPSGFLASGCELYFLDNGFTDQIYRIDLSGDLPATPDSLATGAEGSIYAMAGNPFDHTLWFASADYFGGGDTMYLYKLFGDFSGVQLNASFTKPQGGGSGPIVFLDRNMLLYGESVYLGDGSFHLVNTATGELEMADYLTFPGGLSAAAYGPDNAVYAASGAGSALYRIWGGSYSPVAVASGSFLGVASGDCSLFTSANDEAGEVFFNQIAVPESAPEKTVRVYFPIDPQAAGKSEAGVVNPSTTDELAGTFKLKNRMGGDRASVDAVIPPEGRAVVDLGQDFPAVNEGDYLLFETATPSPVAYASGQGPTPYAASVPAAYGAATDTLYVPHIDSGNVWITTLHLVNGATETAKPSISFSTGDIVELDLSPGEHFSASVAELLGGAGGEATWAEITGASGLAGWAFYQSGGAAIAAVLPQRLATSLDFVHNADDIFWWTGMAMSAFGAEGVQATLTPHLADGSTLAPITVTFNDDSHYSETTEALGIPPEAVWFEATSDSPLGGLGVFGGRNGLSLGGYTVMDRAASLGVMPRTGSGQWSGICLINTSAQTATVALRALTDSGRELAGAEIVLAPGAKVLGSMAEVIDPLAEGASHVIYTANVPVSAFQADGTLAADTLAVLPGLAGR